MKQSSLDEQEQLGMELDAQQAENDEDNSDYFRSYDDPNLNSNAPGPGGESYVLKTIIIFTLCFCQQVKKSNSALSFR